MRRFFYLCVFVVLVGMAFVGHGLAAEKLPVIGSSFDFELVDPGTGAKKTVTLYVQRFDKFQGRSVYWVEIADPAGDEGGLEYDLYDPKDRWVGRITKKPTGFPVLDWPIFDGRFSQRSHWTCRQIVDEKAGGGLLKEWSLKLIATRQQN